MFNGTMENRNWEWNNVAKNKNNLFIIQEDLIKNNQIKNNLIRFFKNCGKCIELIQ